MSGCCPDPEPGEKYDVLRSVADAGTVPDSRYRFEWISRPGVQLPEPPAPSGDPLGDDPHLGFRPVT